MTDSAYLIDNECRITAPDAIRIERMLPGPAERVWRYLTEPELRRQWLAAGEFSLSQGGEIELLFDNSELTDENDVVPEKHREHAGRHRVAGKVIACDEPRLLSFTWGGEIGEASEVTFTLTPHADRVLLVLTHQKAKSRGMMVSISGGWHTHLDLLAAKLEGRTPDSFWRKFAVLEQRYEQLIPE